MAARVAQPLKNANAPLTPFAMSTSRLAATTQAEQQEASRDIENANNYVLAVALFFGGISTRLQSPRPRAVLLGLGSAVLVDTLAWVATLIAAAPVLRTRRTRR